MIIYTEELRDKLPHLIKFIECLENFYKEYVLKESSEKVCPECQGLGIIKENTPVGTWTEDCKNCNGTGQVAS